MGLRPNQPRRRLLAAPPRCRHSNPPVPVEVHGTLDGHPEVVAWLCPDCYDETYPPRPRGTLSHPGEAADITPLLLSGATTAESIQRIPHRR